MSKSRRHVSNTLALGYKRISKKCDDLLFLVQWKVDLADTDLAENLDLKDTPQKILATIFYFYYISLLEIAENLVLADKRSVTDLSAKSRISAISGRLMY